MPEDPGGYLSQAPLKFVSVAVPLHAPVVIQPAAPPVPIGAGPAAPAPTPATPPTDWTKLGIFAAIGAAVVFVLAGRKKKRK